MGFFSWQSSASGKSMYNDHVRKKPELTGQWLIKDGQGREDRFNFTGYEGYGVFSGELESSGRKGLIDIYEVFGGLLEDPEMSVDCFVHDDEGEIEERLRLVGIDLCFKGDHAAVSELRQKSFPRLLLDKEIEKNRGKAFSDLTPAEDCPRQGYFRH